MEEKLITPAFEILPESFEIPHLQKMFTKEQLAQKLFEFGLSNGVSLRDTVKFINTL